MRFQASSETNVMSPTIAIEPKLNDGESAETIIVGAYTNV
jgi:hypothetical protein